VERRPGRRYISEVVEVQGYDPNRDLFDCSILFARHAEKP